MSYSIKTFNTICAEGLEILSSHQYHIDQSNSTTHPDAILLRSHALQLNEIPSSVKVIGRAGAGVNNIPVAALTTRGIPVLNTPGANANAVKELVIAGLLLSSRRICQAWSFVQQLPEDEKARQEQVEQGKKQFSGQELQHRTLGVIGLGAIGVRVANAAVALGMRVIGYDSAISIKYALELSPAVEQASSLDDLLAISEYVTIHVPLTDNTKALLNAERLNKMPKNSILLNFSRAQIVDEASVLEQLTRQHLAYYVSDFPSTVFKNHPNAIFLPHLGASTEEAETNCAVMVAHQLHAYLETGNITNSVNFPDIYLARAPNNYRIALCNANVPSMIEKISRVLAKAQLNIVDMVNKSRQDIAYTLIDVDNKPVDAVLQQLKEIDGILTVRGIV